MSVHAKVWVLTSHRGWGEAHEVEAVFESETVAQDWAKTIAARDPGHCFTSVEAYDVVQDVAELVAMESDWH